MKNFTRKTIPILFLPLNIFLILTLISLFQNSYDLIYLWIIILSILSTGFSSSILWKIIESPWEQKNIEEIKEKDFVVVLSSSISLGKGKKGIYEWGNINRFLAGLDILKNKKANYIIFTGAKDPFNSSSIKIGDFYKEKALYFGITPDKIFVTQNATNTFEEAFKIKQLLKELNYPNKKELILVTDAFHICRAKKIFSINGLKILPFPVNFKSGYKYGPHNINNPSFWLPNSSCLNLSSIALKEIIGRIKYTLSNRLFQNIMLD